MMVEKLHIPIEYVTELVPCELLLLSDCQYGEGNVTKFFASQIAMIDHHEICTESSDFTEIRPGYGSCCTVVYSMLVNEGFEIKQNGDLAYPCFNLAKVLRNSPINIANTIKEKIVLDNNISKVEAVNGFLNFYLNSENIVNDVLGKIIDVKEEYGSTKEGEGINIIVEYSSPNIAKPFHLGHFRNTVLGKALYDLYSTLGYNVTGINHLGDWGRQFGILIEGYKRFKDEYDFEKEPLGALSDIYVRINKIAKEDEAVMDTARENFKKLEKGDKGLTKLWEFFREVSLKEYKRIYDLLGSKFDSYNIQHYIHCILIIS